MKSKFLIFSIYLVFLISGFIYAKDGLETVSDFHLVSGEDQEISLSDFSGDIIICFYESKNSAKINMELKNRLRETTIFKNGNVHFPVLAVADCSSAKWPFMNAWKNALIRRSQEVGYTVYGDWDGAMRNEYNFAKNESNFIIIDKTGIIRYRAFGKISSEEIEKIIDLITILL